MPQSDIRMGTNSIDFGEVGVGYNKLMPLSIYNDGTADLNITFNFINPAFDIPIALLTIPAGELGIINAKFTPDSEQQYSGTIIVLSNDPDTPIIDIPVTGSGIIIERPAIKIDTSLLNFGETFLEEYTRLPLKIENIGSASLNISLDFGQNSVFMANNLNTVIEPLSFVNIDIFFYPIEAKSYEGRVKITSNDPDTPELNIDLEGVGLEHRNIPLAPNLLVPTLIISGLAIIGATIITYKSKKHK